MKAENFNGSLKGFLGEYRYQPQLTSRLDGIGDVAFSQDLINEIVLWKLNRYVFLDSAVLQSIDALRCPKTGQHRQAEAALLSLLGTHGLDLPMASTILRFRNARAFQIIDRHAYRAVYDQDYPLYTGTSPCRKITVYFDYLDRLVELCEKRELPFESIDRLLYVFDKRQNGSLKKGECVQGPNAALQATANT